MEEKISKELGDGSLQFAKQIKIAKTSMAPPVKIRRSYNYLRDQENNNFVGLNSILETHKANILAQCEEIKKIRTCNATPVGNKDHLGFYSIKDSGQKSPKSIHTNGSKNTNFI